MTKEERHLWYDFLKLLPFTIHRQKVIGNYIADFYCAKAGLIIEIDGSQHYEDAEQEKDKLRDEYFNELGIKVVRYSNLDINRNFEGVCEDILQHIATSSGFAEAQPPSPQGEGRGKSERTKTNDNV